MISIIPAIDIIDGKCVRLTQGNYNKKKIYNENPLEVAKMFEDYGIRNLHLVDLDGAKSEHIINYKVLEKITSKTNLVVDFGGGIKTDEDIKLVFNCGAHKATIGSIAITDKEIFVKWLHEYGNNRIILGADIMDNKIAISGWHEITNIVLKDFIEEYRILGVSYVLCTDISKDGMLQGTSLELYKYLRENFSSLNIIASGGVENVNEIEELENVGIYGVIIGKAIYEGKILARDLMKFL